jgi:hypothetical protein
MASLSNSVGSGIILLCMIIALVLSFPLKLRDGLYPQCIILILLLLSVLRFVKDIKRRRKSIDEDKSLYKVLAAILLTILYVFSAELLGFWLSTVLFMITMFIALKEKNWLLIIIFPPALVLFIYIVFYKFLYIPFPQQSLF